MAATKNDTLPMATRHAPSDTEPDRAPVEADARATDPSAAPTAPAGPEPESLGAILENMAPARIWSPNASLGASSNGADFAAYQAGAHAVARAHDANPSGSPVIVDVTAPDLATLVERAEAERARREAAADRDAPTLLVDPARSLRRRRAIVLVTALVLVCAVGLVRARRPVTRPLPSSATSTTGSSSGSPPVAAPAPAHAPVAEQATSTASTSAEASPPPAKSIAQPIAASPRVTAASKATLQAPTPTKAPSAPPAASASSGSSTAKFFPEERY